MNLEELRTQVAIDESGSQAAASRALGLSRATLHRRLALLEERIGVQLARTGPQGVELTFGARGIARQARRVVDESNALRNYAKDITGRSHELLRIGVPLGLPTPLFAQVVGTFREQRPDLRFEIEVCADPMAQIEGTVDLVLHFGATVPSGPWESFPVVVVPEYAAASARYLATHGTPTSLADLRDHTLLGQSGGQFDSRCWHGLNGARIPIEPTIVCNDMLLLVEMVKAGLGIAVIPEPLLTLAGEGAGALVKVLPDRIRIDRSITVIAHESTLELPQIQFVLDMLRDIRSHPGLLDLVALRGAAPIGDRFE